MAQASVTAAANGGVNMETIDLSELWDGEILVRTSTLIKVEYWEYQPVEFRGNFTYDGAGNLTGGVLTSIASYNGDALAWEIKDFSVSAVQFADWIRTDNTPAALAAIFGGNDVLTGSNYNDHLIGYAGDDYIDGGPGAERRRR
jgi:hypothetical protein